MGKNKLVSKDKLINYFKNINELENRKITYGKAISEVEQEIENAKIYDYYAQPDYPKIKYNFSLIRLLVVFFGLFFSNAFLIDRVKPIRKFFYVDDNHVNIIYTYTLIFFLAVISICLEVFLYFRARNKAKKQYLESCDEVDIYNKQQKEEAEQLTELILAEKSPDLNEWQSLNDKIEERLECLYDMQVIPEKYQNAVAISFFVSYLESGRCDTLKECMNKYDDDAIYYHLKGRLEEIYQRIGEMEGRLSREIRYLQRNFESDLQDIQILVDNNSSQIDRISYNQKTNELLSTALLIGNL